MNSGAWQQLKGELSSYGQRVDSHGFTAGFDFIQGIPSEIITTFPNSWLEEYQANSYILSDPVVIWGSQYEGFKNWDELLELYPANMPDVISAARSSGMVNGSVLSISVNRTRAIIGITHYERSLSEADRLELFGLLAKMCIECEKRKAGPEISELGRRYLQLVSEGLTDKEIAERQGVSQRAVSALRERVMAKLSAPTLATALLSAYKYRIID
ncbi:autoinducer binding domain-containing protein [Pseudophaeobacter arcticus]|jgi:DNA-binding CsgD family transcriptional regulator|uniref:helix-turn-helix transcriptional regulator n=1 Tax=Pseudophaeobacter arcticus TaxID=385492 RepID=UPI0004896894|nr:LuxR family transcriptional regulator [Pseudophaeobacter arcticus]